MSSIDNYIIKLKRYAGLMYREQGVRVFRKLKIVMDKEKTHGELIRRARDSISWYRL